MFMKLKKSPIPLGDDEKDIRSDPILCYTCWNLYAGSTNTASFSPVVLMNSNVGPRNAARAAACKDIGPGPKWAGGPYARVDYASWQVSVALAEIPGSAKSGCDSCRLLYMVIHKLGDGCIDFNDPLFRIEVIICKDNVLRLYLKKDNIAIDVDYDIFGNNTSTEEVSTKHIASWELYTLPSM